MPHPAKSERRSLTVVVLDTLTRLAVAAQYTPRPRTVPIRSRRSNLARSGCLAAGVLLALAGTATVVVALLGGPDELASLPPQAQAQARPAASPATAELAPPATASATTASRSEPGSTPLRRTDPASTLPPALAARFSTVGGTTGILGYQATVTIENAGAVEHTGWRLTLTLPRPSLRIEDLSGASVRQDGATWTFEPVATTRTVPAGETVLVSFRVSGATLLESAPQDCRIDDQRCEGIDG